ncbi:MAG: hypothetical protein HYW24_02455 [Candidatus Aenigmarchaeota archaeon]|nr:hypothetical protein [Candidatus Aenigmarchaeota archaeon]
MKLEWNSLFNWKIVILFAPLFLISGVFLSKAVCIDYVDKPGICGSYFGFPFSFILIGEGMFDEFSIMFLLSDIIFWYLASILLFFIYHKVKR